VKTKEYIVLLEKLANREVTPRSIVGTGYKDGREVAYGYLIGMLAQAYELEQGND